MTAHPGEGKYICEECGKRYAEKRPFTAKCPECRQFPSEILSDMGEIQISMLRRRLWGAVVVILIFGALLYLQWIVDHLAILTINVVGVVITFWIAKWLVGHRILATLFVLLLILLFIMVPVFKYGVDILLVALVNIPFVIA